MSKYLLTQKLIGLGSKCSEILNLKRYIEEFVSFWLKWGNKKKHFTFGLVSFSTFSRGRRVILKITYLIRFLSK